MLNRSPNINVSENDSTITFNEVDNGLFTTALTLENGKIVYFNLERIDKVTNDFWHHYADLCKKSGRHALQDANKAAQNAENLAEMKKFYCPNLCSEKKYEIIAATYGALKQNVKKEIFHGIEEGCIAFASAIKKIDGSNYVGFITKDQITTKHTVWKQAAEYDFDAIDKEFVYWADRILMCVGLVTNPGSPTTTHYGIFRSPLSFLDNENPYKNLAMLLHGYLAVFALLQLECKKYMVTKPVPKMLDMFLQNKFIASTDVHYGTVQHYRRMIADQASSDLENPELNLMYSHPPIIYGNGLLEEGIAADELLQLDDKALSKRLTYKEEARINGANEGLDPYLPVAISLASLAKNFTVIYGKGVACNSQPNEKKEVAPGL